MPRMMYDSKTVGRDARRDLRSAAALHKCEHKCSVRCDDELGREKQACKGAKEQCARCRTQPAAQLCVAELPSPIPYPTAVDSPRMSQHESMSTGNGETGPPHSASNQCEPKGQVSPLVQSSPCLTSMDGCTREKFDGEWPPTVLTSAMKASMSLKADCNSG